MHFDLLKCAGGARVAGTPSQAMTLREKIIEALDKAQCSIMHHPKLLKSVKALHDAAEVVAFFEAFIQPLTAALVVFKREPAVERVMDFVAKLAAATLDLEEEEKEEEGMRGKEEEVIGKLSSTTSAFLLLIYIMYILLFIIILQSK